VGRRGRNKESTGRKLVKRTGRATGQGRRMEE